MAGLWKRRSRETSSNEIRVQVAIGLGVMQLEIRGYTASSPDEGLGVLSSPLPAYSCLLLFLAGLPKVPFVLPLCCGERKGWLIHGL